MAAPTNSGESGMATEDFFLNLSPLPSPRWSPLRLIPLPPRPSLPSSNSNYSMVMLYQGSNQSMYNPPQNQEPDDMVDPPPYLAGDSALLQQLRQNWSEASDWGPGGGIMRMNMVESQSNNQGFEEESEEMMTTCFYFPPSPAHFPLYPPPPTVFFVSSQQDISLALSCQHIFEDKSSALHVMKGGERHDVVEQLFDGVESYLENKFGDWDQIARAAGVVPKGMEELVDNIRRINWLEQHDEDIVDQPVFEQVIVVQQLIQKRGGELDMILGEGVSTINGLERKDSQGLPTTPETLLICQAKFSFRVWLGHSGQWAAKLRYNCNRLNIGSFTTVEDAISTYKVVGRWSGWEDLTRFSGLFGNENRSKLPLQLPSPAQEEKPDEDFGLVCCNATENDEIEAVGTGSAGTADCVMADCARLNSGCLGKRKTNRKNPGGERRNMKTNGVRIAIPLDDISQIKGMRLKDPTSHLGVVSQSSLKYACREYGIPRRPPRKLITQSHPNKTPTLVDQEGIPQLNSDTLLSDQALAAPIEKITSVVVKEIMPLPFLPATQQESLDEDFGNFEAEAVGTRSGGTRQSEMKEGQLNSRYLGKEKRKEMTPIGERRKKETSGVRIAISLEEILQTKEMPLKDAAKHLKVSKSTLKRACREYDIPIWPPRGEHNPISQSCPNESPTINC